MVDTQDLHHDDELSNGMSGFSSQVPNNPITRAQLINCLDFAGNFATNMTNWKERFGSQVWTLTRLWATTTRPPRRKKTPRKYWIPTSVPLLMLLPCPLTLLTSRRMARVWLLCSSSLGQSPDSATSTFWKRYESQNFAPDSVMFEKKKFKKSH